MRDGKEGSTGRTALEVFVFGEAGFTGSLVFTSRQVTVGRDARAMVRLDDPSVSLRHAVLELEGTEVTIRDLGSRAGTVVNGRAITGGVVVRPTDEVYVGVFRLRIAMHRPEAAREAAPARPAAIAVPTPFEEITVLADRRNLNPATQVMERRPMPSEDEVTVTGLVVRAPEAAAPQAPAPAAGAATHPRDLWPEVPRAPEPSATDLGDATSTNWQRAPSGQPVQQVQTSPRVVAATAPIAFQPARPPAAAVIEAPPTSAPSAMAPPSALAPLVSRAVPQAAPAVERSRAAARARAPVPAAPPVLRAWPAGAAHEEDDEDEDEDDDTSFVPPFDLLAEISRVGANADFAAGALTVEAVHFRGDRVLSIHYVAPSTSLRLAGVEIGARDAGGAFTLAPRASRGITVRQGGQRRPYDESDVKGGRGLTLCAGMQVELELAGDDGVLVQLVPRARGLAPMHQSLRPMVERLKPGAASIGVHLALFVIFGLTMLGGKNAIADNLNEGRFATIKVQEPEIAPPPTPPDIQLPDPTPTVPSHAAKRDPAAPKSKAKVVEHEQPQAASPTPPEPGAAAQNILKALGGSSNAPAMPDVAALANLDAMPRGRSGFRVSDAVGKGPGDSLKVGAGGADSAVNTKTAAELGNVGKLDVKPGTGAVRARVSAVPAGISGEGHLDRGAIQKVVNSHLYQVQGCYERQLAANPNLAGKATFQWVVTTSGGVAGVRVAGSSLASVEAMSCIQAAIARWSFPKPEGGSVTVTYPFAFTTFGN